MCSEAEVVVHLPDPVDKKDVVLVRALRVSFLMGHTKA
jgi:hypothetical protein